jgi:RimJ/RimL family protein N-acetyltransferase
MSRVIRIAASGPSPALTLRPWSPDDIPALVSAHADPEMRRWMTWHVDDEQQALAALVEQRKHWEMGTRFVFAVVAVVAGEAGDDAGTPIGSVSIRRFAKEPDAAEVGYWTVAQARGKSVAPRAVEGVLAWAQERWADDPVARFNLIHSLENIGSCRVANKLGFALAKELPPFPPKFLEPGHLHVRRVD